MKLSTNYLTNLSKKLAYAAVFSVVFTACKKEDKSAEGIPVAPTRLSVIHASANADVLDFYTGELLSIPVFKYGASNYNVTSGSGLIDYSITKTGDNAKILTKKINVVRHGNYSLFIIDSLQTSTFKFVEDDLNLPAIGKVKIRFANLSSDGGLLDVNIKGQATPLIAKQDFKQVSGFVTIDPSKSYTFEVKANGGTAVLASFDAPELSGGKIYTVFTSGYKNATGTQKNISLKLYLNK